MNKNMGSLFHEFNQLTNEFVGTKWRHIKTGNFYEVTNISIDENSMEFLISYKSTKANIEWTRKLVVFMDGRFQKILPRMDTL